MSTVYFKRGTKIRDTRTGRVGEVRGDVTSNDDWLYVKWEGEKTVREIYYASSEVDYLEVLEEEVTL